MNNKYYLKKCLIIDKERNELLKALLNSYLLVVEVNLSLSAVRILSMAWPDENSTVNNINLLIQFREFLVGKLFDITEKNKLENFLDLNNLRYIAENQNNEYIDVRFRKTAKKCEWIRIKTLYLLRNRDNLYLTFENVDKEHILNAIAEKFVYKNCDCLYYWEAEQNYYLKLFGGKYECNLIPQKGDDFKQRMVQYIKQYVIEADREKAFKYIKHDNIFSHLDKEDQLEICISVNLNGRKKYRRKKIVAQYYDKESRIILIRIEDITKEYLQQRKQEKKIIILEKEIDTDKLTGIYNREGFQKLFDSYLAWKNENEIGALFLIDLDNFKDVNDCMGHIRGDMLLKQIAKILKRNVRVTDIVARIGGDEFMILMKNISDEKYITQCAEKIMKSLQISCANKKEKVFISASVGIAVLPKDGSNFKTLYEKADKALYNAKHNGKNTFSFFA